MAKPYKYVVWEEEGQWAALCPSVPGVYGVGDTEREAKKDLLVALEETIERMKATGERLPRSLPVRMGTLTLMLR
jgi:predicted RNase H-like HicB family nuclease